jgi:hypothetical protein
VDLHKGWNFRIGWNHGELPPLDSRTIDSIQLGQRDMEKPLLGRPEQQRLERVAEEQAHKEKQALVRSTRGLRNLEKKS